MHYKAAWACGQAALRLAHMPTRRYDHHRLSPLVSTRNDEGPSKLEIILTAESDERQRIARLSLTPGDFAAVERGARLHRPATPNELVNRLLSVRPQGSGKLSSPIGFLAHEH